MKRVLKVPTIHCMGCVESIKSKVTGLPGIQEFSGDPDAKTVAVSFDTAAVDEAKIREAIQRSGHQVGS